MKAALIALSERGLFLARCLANALPSDVFGHENCALLPGETPFASLVKVTEWLFAGYPRLIFFTPAGAAVRALSGLPRDKHLDPAVVQVDPAGRFVVSLLSGHEGGANELAFYAAGRLGAVPVVSTATETLKDIVVGVGCRRGTAAGHLKDCVLRSLKKAGVDPGRMRVLATAGCKQDEPGIRGAAEMLGVCLHIVPDSEIKKKQNLFINRPLVQDKVGLPGVSEPAAVLAGHQAELIYARELWPQASIAIARESFMWSE